MSAEALFHEIWKDEYFDKSTNTPKIIPKITPAPTNGETNKPIIPLSLERFIIKIKSNPIKEKIPLRIIFTNILPVFHTLTLILLSTD